MENKIAELRKEIAKLDSEMNEKAKERNEAYKNKDFVSYRKINHEMNLLSHHSASLAIKCGKMEQDLNHISKLKPERYITTATYESALKRTEKAVLRNMGY